MTEQQPQPQPEQQQLQQLMIPMSLENILRSIEEGNNKLLVELLQKLLLGDMDLLNTLGKIMENMDKLNDTVLNLEKEVQFLKEINRLVMDESKGSGE